MVAIEIFRSAGLIVMASSAGSCSKAWAMDSRTQGPVDVDSGWRFTGGGIERFGAFQFAASVVWWQGRNDHAKQEIRAANAKEVPVGNGTEETITARIKIALSELPSESIPNQQDHDAGQAKRPS